LYNFIAIHPAGLGDTLEDLILFKAILKSNENIKIHYICNYFSKELIDISNVRPLYTHPINKKRKININNIKEIISCPKNADLAYVFPGMNLKKIGPLKYFLYPKKYIGALLDYPVRNLKHIIPKNNMFDKVHYGLSGYQRLKLNKYYLSKYMEIGKLDFNILNNEKIVNDNLIEDFNSKESYIVIHIGSSHEYPIRSLGVKKWQQLINEIIQHYSLKVVFVGDPNEVVIINKIINSIDSNNVINLAGKTSIKQLAKLILNAKIVISSDSGPGQIAGIMKKKQIMLFGPTKHTLANPINTNCIKIYRQYECSPCYESVDYYNCPYDSKCLNEISIESIFESIALVAKTNFIKTIIDGDFVERCFSD